jgi:hydrogenase expression/formation protein HypC
MCLAIPGEVIEITETGARVSIEGLVVEADLALSEKIEVGDYVIVHAGFILQKMSREEAAEELEIIRTFASGPEQP